LAPAPAPAKSAPAGQAPAPAQPAPAPATCTHGGIIDHFAPSGGAAIACFATDSRRNQHGECWRIDATGATSALPAAQWPAPSSGWDKGDRTPEQDINDVRVQAPASLKVKIDMPPDGQSPTIEVCSGSSCKRVKLRPQKKPSLSGVVSVAVLADHRTLYAGLGMGLTGVEVIERYDLDMPTAVPQQFKHPNQCALILDELAGNVLVQTSDCANAGGDRLLMAPSGKVLANLGVFASEAPFHALGNDRWLFQSNQGLSIWNLATGKRVAITSDDGFDRRIAVIGGSIVALDRDGTITGFDAALKAKPLGAIPRCPGAP
jgi:hypothetical protein